MRREQPVDPAAGPLGEFARALRELRRQAGEPSYRQLAKVAHYSPAALSEAAKGRKLPTLAVTLAYVRACGGDEVEWQARWLRVHRELATAEISAEEQRARDIRAGVAPLGPDDPAAVGPFRLLGRLGAGAMGQVYLGRTRGRRLVAVKVVRPAPAGDRLFRERFAREIAAARQVHGLYVAPLVDADPAGTPPWLATAYIPGPTLREAVNDHGPLPPESLVALAAGVAEALVAIHAAKLVHRDLKPANVILADDGPRVIDFGVARALDAVQLTEAGAGLGTVGFAAPEQARGQPAGPEADIFALGAVLAYAATGRPPYGEGPTESIRYRLDNEVPDIDGVPPELLNLVEACLNPDLARRPTAAEVLRRCEPDGEAPAGPGWLPPLLTADIYARGRSAAELTAGGKLLAEENTAGSKRRWWDWRLAAGLVTVIALVAAFAVGVLARSNPAGSLQLRLNHVPPNVDLTALGTDDWVHWGHLPNDTDRIEEFVGGPVHEVCDPVQQCTNRKHGVGRIGDYSMIGNAAPTRLRVRDAPITFAWRDGEPVTAAKEVRSQIHVGLKGNGFRIAVPADRTVRTFTLYFGLFRGRSACAARLSDASAPPVVDNTFSTFGRPDIGFYSTCTVVYQAGRAATQLVVELTLAENGAGGNVALFAATLRT